MTVSISKMSIDYYLETAMTADAPQSEYRREMSAYYTETATPVGRWFGAGLDGLSVNDGEEVTRQGAKWLYDGMRDPATGELLGKPLMKPQAPAARMTPKGNLAPSSRQGVAGFDLTFSAPKSVSTIWALGDYAMQRRIEAAHHQAMRETLQWVEQNVAQTRAGHGGVAHVPVTGVVGSMFDHWESREGDPQLHSHAVISNRVQRSSDGQWVTLDSYTLHRHVVAISETYNSLLMDRLHEQVGTIAESREATTAPPLEQALRTAVAEADQRSPEMRHRVELAGVPDALIEEFSTRSASIEARSRELTEEYLTTHGYAPNAATVLQLRQRATLETRPGKDDGAANLPLSEMKHQWRQRAITAGHDPATILEQAVGHSSETIKRDALTPEVQQVLARWALDDASRQRATFTRANVLASTERVARLVRCDSAEDRRELIDGLVDRAMDSAVALTPRRSTTPAVADASVTHRGVSVFDHYRHAGVFTTRDALEAEEYLLSRHEELTGPRLDADEVRTRVGAVRTASGHTLSEDQARASAAVLVSGRQLDAIIGPAGTGKTTTMRAVSDLWAEDHGHGSVVGLAPSAVAAGVLADELGVSTENTSKWLWEATEGAAHRAQRVAQRTERLSALEAHTADRPTEQQRGQMARLRAQLAADYAAQARYTMHEDQLIIIDEASMVSTHQLHQLNQQAENAGAKVLMVGDPAQLGAVEAGGVLGHIDRHEAPERLDQVWRFNHEWERAASLELRAGNSDVLSTYHDHDRLHGGQEADAADTAYAAWSSDRAEGKDSILIAGDTPTVAKLNQRAQEDLVRDGTVDHESTVQLRADASAGAGDVLLARLNDRNIRDSTGAFISNGTRLTVTEVRADGSALGQSHSTSGTVQLDAEYLANSTELGYATTAHRAQGVTTDTAHAVADERLSRELFYVAMTRGRERNDAYIGHDEDHSPDPWDLFHQHDPADTAVGMLTPIVQRGQAEKTAHEVQAAELAWSNDLGRIMHEREYLGWAGRSERTQQWVAQSYPPEQAARITADPEWNTLTQADPARLHTGTAAPEDTPAEIIARCTVEDFAPAGETRIEHPAHAATPGQDHLLADADARIRAELASRRTALAQTQDPPEWYIRLNADITDPGHRREAVDAVLAWRAVSDRDDTPHALGPRPSENDRLRPYYDRAAATLAPREPWTQNPAAQRQSIHGQHLAERFHAQRITPPEKHTRQPQPVAPIAAPARPEPQRGPDGPGL